MSERITEFIFNGKGAVTLQVTTLVLMLIMSWNISAWKTNIENTIQEGTKNRWTSVDMSEWSNKLAQSNDDLDVPSVWSVVDYE
jgi:hypothetical protein